MRNEDKKEILLTKDQYLTLVKLAYLGNWMANSHRDGSEEDPLLVEYENMIDQIFSMAQDFGFPDTFEHDLECNDHGKVTEVNRLLEEYDESTFWEELCERMGQMEFHRKYSPNERKNMDQEEHFTKFYECVDFWQNEVDKYGLERFHILKLAKGLE